MPSLQDVLGGLPPVYGAYAAARGAREQSGMRDLQQASTLVNLQSVLQQQAQRQTAMQEEARIRQTVQGAKTPQEAVDRLIATGHPKAIELAGKIKGLLPPPKQFRSIGAGGAIDEQGKLITPMARPETPKQFAPPEFLRLQEAAAKYPPGHPSRTEIEARLKMLQERPPGTTINMPASSDTVQGADGKFYKFRIGKDGKPEVIPFQTQGGEPLRPPESAATAKLAEDKAADAQTLENVRARINKMASLIQGGGMAGGVVGPLGMASRIGETAVGAVQPSASTPALDYQNEMRLLLSDVRKMVEKDPNLSKDEREAMYETLGGGIMQTPGSAIRTLNNIVSHVESKQRSGPPRAPAPEQRQKNTIYQTPRGPMRWTGTGWLPAN